jgi:hypothetical protein
VTTSLKNERTVRHNADLVVYDNAGKQVASSRNFGNESEAIALKDLSPGEYYVKVLGRGKDTKYRLSMLATPQPCAIDDDDSLTKAKALGDSVKDSIGRSDRANCPADQVDYSRFEVKETEYVTLNLDGMSANANLELVRNENGKEEVLSSSANGGDSVESISRILTPGVYYTRVTPGEKGTATDYILGKVERSVEGLLLKSSGDRVYEVQGGKRRGIPDVDTLKVLKLNEKPVNTVSDADLNQILEGEAFPSLKDGAFLKGSDGKFYLMQDGKRRLVADPINKNIAKTISDWDLNRISQDRGIRDNDDTLASAEVFTDRIQDSIGEKLDPYGSSIDRIDYSRIEVKETEYVTLTLNGMSANANLELIQDKNRNNQADADEVIASSKNSGTKEEVISRILVQDVYYTRVTSENNTASSYILSKVQQSIRGLLIQDGSGKVFSIQEGKRRYIPDVETFNELRLDPNSIKSVSDEDLNKIPLGSDFPSRRDGTLLENDGKIYIIRSRKLRLIPDSETFALMGLSRTLVKKVSTQDLGQIPIGFAFPSRKDSTLLRESNGTIYLMQSGSRHYIPDPDKRGLDRVHPRSVVSISTHRFES